MGEKLDDAKGRVKVAMGDLTDDEQLKREGKIDRAGAKAKEKIIDGSNRAKDLVDDAQKKAEDVTQKGSREVK